MNKILFISIYFILFFSFHFDINASGKRITNKPIKMKSGYGYVIINGKIYEINLDGEPMIAKRVKTNRLKVKLGCDYYVGKDGFVYELTLGKKSEANLSKSTKRQKKKRISYRDKLRKRIQSEQTKLGNSEYETETDQSVVEQSEENIQEEESQTAPSPVQEGKSVEETE